MMLFRKAEMIGFDYRAEHADLNALLALGWRHAILSWRCADGPVARAKLDAFLRGGGTFGVNVEPFVRFGTHYESDKLLATLADHYGAYLRNPDGSLCLVGREWGWNAMALDFSVPGFPAAWARLIHGLTLRATSHYQDYGFLYGGIGWAHGLSEVPPEKWEAWGAGLREAMSLLSFRTRVLGTGTRLDLRAVPYGDVFVIEGIELDNRPSRPLFTYRQALETARAISIQGRRPLLFCLHSDERHLRIISTIAVMTGALLSYRRRDLGEVWVNRPAPFVTNTRMGRSSSGLFRTIRPDVWEMHTAEGVAVLNLSSTAHSINLDGVQHTIPGCDALVVDRLNVVTSNRLTVGEP